MNEHGGRMLTKGPTPRSTTDGVIWNGGTGLVLVDTG